MSIARNESPEQRARRLERNRAYLRKHRTTTKKTIAESKLARRRAKWKERKALTAEGIAERERKAAERQARAVERAERLEAERIAREARRNVIATPAADQPLPECPREAELFQLLQLDAILWRSRIAPTMPCDPAQYVHGSGGVDAGPYRNSDGSMVTACDDGDGEP